MGLTLAKISAAQAPEGPPPMTATRIGLSSAMLTLETGLRICCTPARPPATRLKAVEGIRASMTVVQIVRNLAVWELLMIADAARMHFYNHKVSAVAGHL